MISLLQCRWDTLSGLMIDPPVNTWVMCQHDGTVETGHCICMAGLGEVCSHVAAILFYLESALHISTTCTAFHQIPQSSIYKLCMEGATSGRDNILCSTDGHTIYKTQRCHMCHLQQEMGSTFIQWFIADIRFATVSSSTTIGSIISCWVDS